MTKPQGDARRAALEAIGPALSGTAKVQEVLWERADALQLDRRDRALARELSAGCVRRLGTLDHILRAFSRTEWGEVKEPVRNLLRLGLYQLLYSDGIPARAAVNETVQLAHDTGFGRASGLVNGMLRAIERDVTFATGRPPKGASIVCRPGRWATFKTDLLPDPKRAHAAYVALRHSYPEWLVRRWLARYGPEKAEALCLAGNEEAPVFLRPQPPKADMDTLLALLREEGIDATPSPSGRTVKLPRGIDTRRIKALKEGVCLVQDDSAAAVAPFLNPGESKRVLDLCAAPGGKSAHLAALVGSGGEVVAVDNSARRLERMMENLRRLGLSNVATVQADGRNLPDLGSFDAVLVDAPCSNTGVLRRRLEARWRVTESTLTELSQLQYALALSAAQALKSGGRMVYCTCTMEPEENQNVLTRLIGAGPDLAMEEEHQILPASGGGDGAYMARLIRRG